MKHLSLVQCVAIASLSALSSAFPALAANSAEGSSTAIVYFSLAENAPINKAMDGITGASLASGEKQIGTTAAMARTAAKILQAPLISLRVKNAYSSDFDQVVSRGHAEQATPPELVSIPDLHGVETLLIGYPTWNMAPASPVMTFLAQARNRDDVKQIYVFNTNDGWGPGRGPAAIAAAFPHAHVNESVLVIHSQNGAQGSARMEQWIKSMALNQPAAANAARQITAQAGGHNITITLNDSPEAKQFRQMLERGEITVRMSEFGQREFYGPTDEQFTVTSQGQYRFEDGTLTFCPTNNTIAIFYAQSAQPTLSMAVYPLGRVTSDLSIFKDLPRQTNFTFGLK